MIGTPEQFKTWFNRLVISGRYTIELNTCNCIILRKNGLLFCPITAIRQELTGEFFSSSSWPKAIEGMMNRRLARNVVRAADNTFKSDRSISAELRKYMLNHLELQKIG